MQKCHVSGVLSSLDNGLQLFFHNLFYFCSFASTEFQWKQSLSRLLSTIIVEKTKRESSSNLKAAGVFNLLTALLLGGSHGCSQTFVFRLRSFFVSFRFSQTVRGLSTESVAVQPGCHIGFRPADQIVVFVFIITVCCFLFGVQGLERQKDCISKTGSTLVNLWLTLAHLRCGAAAVQRPWSRLKRLLSWLHEYRKASDSVIIRQNQFLKCQVMKVRF